MKKATRCTAQIIGTSKAWGSWRCPYTATCGPLCRRHAKAGSTARTARREPRQ